MGFLEFFRIFVNPALHLSRLVAIADFDVSKAAFVEFSYSRSNFDRERCSSPSLIVVHEAISLAQHVFYMRRDKRGSWLVTVIFVDG